MPIFFQRPENALKRANEFIDVGKKNRALDALYDVIKSKKHRTWQKIHEPIMEKYLELCVDLKKSHIAKEGLYQYKNICQQVNIKSLEDVVRKYLSMAEEKTEQARNESHQAVVDVDDLDVIQTPENLLMSAVSGEDTQDRTDRAILTPWVKFLWESYRQCLDLLRNNNSVEKLYQDIARDAFSFCLKYERKTEFRKLCDNLRTHLGHIHKHQHQHRAINLDDPDSQSMHLETRLTQLNSAVKMELWGEAFKAVEDIHGLITKPKKIPKPSLMANYYNKLALVFWKSGNYLFHACAWHRYYQLCQEQRKNLSQSEHTKLASRVLCATLAIPIPASRNAIDQLMEMDENAQEKQRRLATLLGLNSPPTRAQLVKDLYKYNVIGHVHPELKELYQWLEVEFHPLKLSQRVAAPLKFIGSRDDLSQYVPALQNITVTRLIKQVSQMYETIEFERLAKLAPFSSIFQLERIVVDTARNLELQVRIDHRTRSLSFGTDLCVAQKEDVPEGPYLQSMPSEQIRNQLTFMASSLTKAMKIVRPEDVRSSREELRQQIMQKYRLVARQEHARILQRRQIIEERKEELENINTQREQKELEMLQEQQKRQYEAEMARLEKEAEERERQRRIEEHQTIQKRMAKERLDQLKSTELGAKAFADLKEEEIASMDVDDILAKQVEQLEKEKKELQEKLKSQEKKVDYLERAKRLEEIPLLKTEFEDWKKKDQEWFLLQESERIEQMKKDREAALEHRNRLRRMEGDKDDFLNKLKQDRVSLYKDKLAKFEEKFIEEKKKRLAERKIRRKEERRAAWYKAKQEEEQRKRDEEAKRQREEEERIAREKREAEEAEYQEKLRKLEEQEEKKRQREREIEERLAAEKEAASKAAAAAAARPDDREPRRNDTWRRGEKEEGPADKGRWRPAGATTQGGGWRDRVQKKEESWKREDSGKSDEGDVPGEWRRGGARDEPPPRDRRDERGPRDDRRDDRGPRDDYPPRGGDRRDDRPPPAREEGAWRAAPRDRDDRGPARGGPRDDFRREERKDDGGGWRRGGDDRGGDRGGWREGDRGADRPSGGRDDAWRRDDRGGASDRGSGGGRWDRGSDRRDDRGPRDDRGSREERGGGAWRGGERREPAAGGDSWRRGGGGGADDRAPRDDWRRGPAAGGADRGAPPQRPAAGDKAGGPPPREGRREGDDGWTTVKR